MRTTMPASRERPQEVRTAPSSWRPAQPQKCSEPPEKPSIGWSRSASSVSGSGGVGRRPSRKKEETKSPSCVSQ